ncbi:hypothetical protein LIER_40883 [Lithospermum erythrorhizon]|uniref:Uncharacterized protein n=1 Tax=Lithospermum erythrorhizon TaxID=34254 RepID=A0AAV3R139_LITER
MCSAPKEFANASRLASALYLTSLFVVVKANRSAHSVFLPLGDHNKIPAPTLWDYLHRLRVTTRLESYALEVKLTQLYGPLENSPGLGWVLLDFPKGLIRDHLYWMGLKVGLERPDGYDEGIHQLLRLKIACLVPSHDSDDVIHWPLNLGLLLYQDTAKCRL